MGERVLWVNVCVCVCVCVVMSCTSACIVVCLIVCLWSGLIDPAAFARYAEFGDWIRGCYGSDNIVASVSMPTGNIVTLPLPNASNLDRVVLQENQEQDDTIIAYTLQATTTVQSEWVTVGTGMSVGNKRIHLFDRAIAHVTGLRVILNTSSASASASQSGRGDASLLKSFWTVSLEACGGSPPTPPHNCPPPASGQEVGAYDCGYGAQQKWRLEPGETSAGQQDVSRSHDLLKIS